MPSLPHRSSSGPTVRQREHWRGKTKDRGYDSDWKRLRLAKLAMDPFCEIRTNCMGAIATEVDHIQSIEERPDLRLAWSNLQSACKPCNAAKARQKAQESGGSAAKSSVFVSL